MLRIDAKTKVCALLGHPVGHSLSPEIHNAAFEALDLPFVYVAHDVQPGEVGKALEGIRAMGYRGLSVTIPHKVEAMQAVDHVDPTAEGIGCINTVVNDGGRLLGYNSDGLGALGALRAADADPRERRALVLGSGGAARAIAITLAREAPPQRLAIMGIEVPQLEQLADDVRRRGHCAQVVAVESTPSTLEAEMKSAEIVLHCSPIGMHPHEDASLVPASLFRAEQVVFDAVYNPRETRLLREAAAAGCRTIPGLEMFLGQAYVQFQLWTDRDPPRDVMRAIVETRL